MAEHSNPARDRGPLYLGSVVMCGGCSRSRPLTSDTVRDWLTGSSEPCDGCHAEFDLWQQMVASVQFTGIPITALSVVGAYTTFLGLPMPSSEVITLTAERLGIPSDAHVLRVLPTVNLNGNDKRAPTLVPLHHGQLPVTRINLPLHMAPFPTGLDVGGVTINFAVTWISRPEAPSPVLALIDAFNAYADGRFAEAVLPANVAVETALREVTERALRRFASNEAVRSFRDAATYSHQWNTVLPLLVGLTGSTKLPDHVVVAVNRLRKLRNKVGHGEQVDAGAVRDQAEVMVAAVLAVEYLDLIGPTLRGET